MPTKLIEDLAEKLKVDISGLSLVEAVRLLQRLEGNFDCFARAESGFCSQKECLFYLECMENSSNTED
ncbi:hypothetical protein [Maridesulfovibrio zosterae]|uniref:hypothetical protein n=1 Tax=Maridesulfovibrio zosterae TaxID=82171 RepID=UPI000418C615|nr:hypothetical protein [Maridesulfovibrio zosterae]